jgi:hypothetical protein
MDQHQEPEQQHITIRDEPSGAEGTITSTTRPGPPLLGEPVHRLAVMGQPAHVAAVAPDGVYIAWEIETAGGQREERRRKISGQQLYKLLYGREGTERAGLLEARLEMMKQQSGRDL